MLLPRSTEGGFLVNAYVYSPAKTKQRATLARPRGMLANTQKRRKDVALNVYVHDPSRRE